jgi:hypothetical protein
MMTEGECEGCGRRAVLTPLHGPEKGGPLRCYVCAGVWAAKTTRKRRAGRVLFQALKAFYAVDGSNKEIEHLRKIAAGFDLIGESLLFSMFGTGVLGDMALSADDPTVLTSEVLAAALRLTHPDAHPPERHDLANRVTQQLLALQPFVFPAEKPKPVEPLTPDRDASSKDRAPTSKTRHAYPCADCASTYPLNYCTACRAEWDKRQKEERQRDAAKQRDWYAKRKARYIRVRACAECSTPFKGKRKDARFCSHACRQRAHRKAAIAERV